MDENQVKQWIRKGPSPDLLQAAESCGRELQKEKLTTSQIRQVFSKLKSIEAKGYKNESQRIEFMMLKPYIAYAASRPGSAKGTKILKEKVSWAIDAVLEDPANEKQCFYNFCKFFEAILAYHRAYGGK